MGLLGWAWCNSGGPLQEGTFVCRRGEGSVTMKADIGVMHPQAKECGPTPKAERVEE